MIGLVTSPIESALGHQRPFIAILAQRLLPGVNQPFAQENLAADSRMSAFIESGRSDRQKLGEIRVCFRPQADIREDLE